MERGIRRIQPVVEIGDQIGGEEETEPRLGKETERLVVGVQKLRLERPPFLTTEKIAHDIVRLAAVAAANQKGIARILTTGKGGTHVTDQRSDVRHLSMKATRSGMWAAPVSRPGND